MLQNSRYIPKERNVEGVRAGTGRTPIATEIRLSAVTTHSPTGIRRAGRFVDEGRPLPIQCVELLHGARACGVGKQAALLRGEDPPTRLVEANRPIEANREEQMSIRQISIALCLLAVGCLAAFPALAQYSAGNGGAAGRGYGRAGNGGYSGGYYSGGYYGRSGSFGNTASANPHLGNPNNLSLVVAQTQEGHEGVADLLGQLRRLQDQQVKQELRFTNLNDSFYERMGVNFGFNIRGADPAGGRGVIGLDPTGQPTPNGDIQFRQGGANAALPPFGGHDPASDATVGFATRGSAGDLLFNFFGGQGSTRNLVTQAPVLVIPNGGQGFVSDTSQTPFVTGVIPVVGAPNLQAMTGFGYPLASQQSALEQRLQQLRYEQIRAAAQRSGNKRATTDGRADGGAVRLGGASGGVANGGGGAGAAGGPSSANHGDLSVAEIRRQNAASNSDADNELAALIERARGAEAAGKANVAKIYYKMAARRAAGEVKQRLIEKVRQIEDQ